MYGKYSEELKQELEEITQSGLYKSERMIKSAQQARINVGENQVLNMCANNYLGLANSPEIIEAVKTGLDERGFGMASVRFICGTQDIHSKLENKISRFFGTDDTILYSSCFDANAGLFETLLGEQDAIISDALNHASIIDGIRLCKAARFRYTHGDMVSLENCLNEAAEAKTRMIATDGVFSMDGDYAKLGQICDLADAHNAIVMVDDSHATGFVGPTGRGTPELCGVQDRVDIITSTLGKALGGASGGFTTGRKNVVEILRQRSRPYLFFQFPGTANCRGRPENHRFAKGIKIGQRKIGIQYRFFQRADCQGRFYHQTRQPSHCSHHVGRCQTGPGDGGPAPRGGSLCGGLFLPGGPQGPGTNPGPDLRRTFQKRYGICIGKIY